MSLASFYEGIFAEVDHQHHQEGIIRETSTNQSTKVEWKEHGTIAGWIKLLETYKRDTKFKLNDLELLKLEGFKLRIDQKELTPELYEASIKLFTEVEFTGTGKIPPKVYNEAVKMLVCFLKSLTRLVEDFRSFYDPKKSPAKLMDRLAKRNLMLFTIYQTGSERYGHSTTIVIDNLLTCSEINETRDVAKMTVATKVVQYMLQLSKIVEIIQTKKDNGELERIYTHKAAQPKSTQELVYEELVEVLYNLKSQNSDIARENGLITN